MIKTPDEFVKISTKFQMVVPKVVRRRLKMTDSSQGYVMRVKSMTDTDVTFEKVPSWRDYLGTMTGAWGPDPVATIRADRDEWDD
jgi:bifunctional DNA-binding transcriptional regulator/antitoxin component of YhaV-PrlF toxin-antitoxin module